MFSPEFSALGIAPELLAALYDLEYQHPSPIQERSIPPLLAGKNILGTAQTGTGKTAAYALPLLQHLEQRKKRLPQALILTPTRELTIQVAQAIEAFARNIKCSILPIYGGSAMGPQLRRLSSGVEIVVGTPGRLLDHLQRGSLDLSAINTVVLDEADEMLRMGFIDDVETILAATPAECQRTLFSATMPAQIRRVADTYLGDAEHIQIASPTSTLDKIEQHYLLMHRGQKLEALKRLLEVERINAAMVFVRTKDSTTAIAQALCESGFNAAALNGDLSQQMREQCVEQLKQGRIDIVVATDVAARGLDVERISHVFNFDIPFDTEAYIHRIGRTGRAGRTGKAILFVTPNERRFLREIEKTTRREIPRMSVPDAAQISTCRINGFKDALHGILTTQDLERMRTMVEEIAAHDGIEMEDLAAALAWKIQQHQPLYPTLDPIEAPDSKPRHKGSNPKRSAAKFSATGAMTGYRIRLGRQHQITPRDIVGAFTNEAGLPIRAIGRIKIEAHSSYIELAGSLPASALNKVKKLKIRHNPIGLEPEDLMAAQPRKKHKKSKANSCQTPPKGKNTGKAQRGALQGKKALKKGKQV